MKCKICNETNVIFPYKHRLCYECYIHISKCESCKNQVFVREKHYEKIESFIMFLVLQILIHIIIGIKIEYKV